MKELLRLKCQNCGEPLDISNAQNGVIKCGVCGCAYTLPKDETPPAAVSFLRQGEHDLDTCRFDEAYSAYAKAADYAPKEPEAYFGMALAEHKIQYLNDVVNNRLQPVCHSVESGEFTSDANFKKALSLSSAEQKSEYARKGEEIDYIKAEFEKIRKSGVDYDCFICVKVTDGNGGRTADYKLADDIYFELKGKGYKPFFSERELIGVVGADYEARILYALNSSECMLVVCGDESYLQTKWVKNEYSRFLQLTDDGEKENNSVAIIYTDKPIERLAGKKGKLQGISAKSLSAMGQIVAFVESHTPEAYKRRQEELNRKNAESEELKRKLAEQEELLKKMQQKINAEEAVAAQPHTIGSSITRFGDLIAKAGKRVGDTIDEVGKKIGGAVGTVSGSAGAAFPAIFGSDFEIKGDTMIRYRGKKKKVIIPENVKIIDNDAFKDCVGLQEVSFPPSLTEIRARAFSGCRSLKKTDLKNTRLNSIGVLSFSGCKELKSVAFPATLEIIRRGAFHFCSSLKKVEFPHDFSEIGDGAFENCFTLKKVKLNKGLARVGNNAFKGCAIKKIKIPKSVSFVGSNAFAECYKDLKIKIYRKSVPDTWSRYWMGGNYRCKLKGKKTY